MYKIQLSTSAHKVFKKFQREERRKFDQVINILEIDPFNPKLKTHKLKGNKGERYSCSLNYKERILFMILLKNEILITDIGNNDDVY